MRRFLLLLLLFIGVVVAKAQELNCTVAIDAEQTGRGNDQIYKSLENQLTDLVNNTSWTNIEYKNQERIDCSITLILSGRNNNNFSGSMQIVSSRPVYNSTYDSPVYNYNDKQVSFNYKEFDNLDFNINSFDSNLVSILAYHIYTMIGLDAATYENKAGERYFAIAKQIVNTASSSNFPGWKPSDGTQSRYQYNNAILSNVYIEYQTALYDYHRTGLDVMEKDQKKAKSAIVGSIKTLKG
ncbi:MAG: hypothetical protein ACI83B_003462, partial [Sediminicola sp.]